MPGLDGGFDGEAPQPAPKKTWSQISKDLSKNRGAMILIAGVLVAGVTAFATKQKNDAAGAGPDTVIAIDKPGKDIERNLDDPKIAALDGAVEDAALSTAKEVGGTYIAPLAPSTQVPDLPPLASIQRPEIPESVRNAANPKPKPAATTDAEKAAAQAEQKRREAMEAAMQKQLAKLGVQVYGPAGNKGVAESDSAGVVAATAAAQASAAQAETRLGYPMGTIWGATLITGADTDRPGTIRAKIEEGPFAGREALCNFDWASREYLNVECFSVKLDTESLPVSMVAVDADTMPNLKAEYDGRYIKRLGGQFLAAFPAAYAEGLAQGGTTTQGLGGTTTSEKELSGKDLTLYATGKAFEPIADEAQQIADEIKPRAYVPPMQVIGLMLAEDI
ncbi:hypothetical protein [Geopseudomonas aromaticivorans]